MGHCDDLSWDVAFDLSMPPPLTGVGVTVTHVSRTPEGYTFSRHPDRQTTRPMHVPAMLFDGLVCATILAPSLHPDTHIGQATNCARRFRVP